MKKTNGESNPSQLPTNVTGVLQKEVERIELQNTLETEIELDDSSLVSFLEENPEVSLSNFISYLELMGNSGWWFTVTKLTSDEVNLMKIIIAPPENYNLKITDNGDEKTVEVVSLNKKD